MKLSPKGVPVYTAAATQSWHWVMVFFFLFLLVTEPFHHLLFVFFLNTYYCHNHYKCVRLKEKHSYDPCGSYKL